MAAAQKAFANTAGVSIKEKGQSGQNATASGEMFSAVSWSDYEDDEVEEIPPEVSALQEAKRVLKAWKEYSVDWKAFCPDHGK